MMNVVILMGRLSSDIELAQTKNGVSVAKFSIAVKRNYGKGGERETDFFSCVAWRNTGEFIQKWFSKGKPIAILGQLQSRKYTDKNGQNRTVVEIVVEDAFFAGNADKSEPESETFQTPPAKKQSKSSSQIDMDMLEEFDDGEDLPF